MNRQNSLALPAKALGLGAVTAVALAACVAGASEIVGPEWHLLGVGGEGAPGPLSLVLDDKGGAAGRGPCNRWFATNSSTLPGFTLSGIGSTKMACDALAAEDALFQALSSMQRAELDQDRLFLIGPEGLVMEFAIDATAPCLSCGG